MCDACKARLIATPAAEAVSLSARSPFAEVLDLDTPARRMDALTLLFGILGVATAAFQWTVSPWFRDLKLVLAQQLVEREWFALLESNAPWWLLTHYPEANDVFTWLDGALVVAYLLGGGFALGGLLLLAPLAASRLLADGRLSWERLSLALTPLAAASVILGLTMLTVSHLKAEHLWLRWLPAFRLGVLGVGGLASLWLGAQLARKARATPWRQGLAGMMMALPVAVMVGVWGLVFVVW